MKTLNPKIDEYLSEGCGRCPLVSTPACKVHKWPIELQTLRALVLESGLKEELKWSMPCYTINNKNVLIISAFKDYCAINFFKGALLMDKKKLLTMPGENSQASRQLRITGVEQIVKNEKEILGLIKQAIQIEKEGKKIEYKKTEEYILPEELEAEFKKDKIFKKAFESLTPGRQKGYIIFFNVAKQSATRMARINKYKPDILKGKGMNDYK